MEIKTRRSKKELVDLITKTTKRILENKNFSKLTLLEIVEESNVDPNVFYRHFGTLDNLFDTIIKEYDFWVNDTIDLSKLNKLGDKDFLAEGLFNLYRELDASDVMQKILLWELDESNASTQRSANMRETMNLNLLGYYGNVFNGSTVDFNAVSAVVIAGIYYLVLHKNTSTFCQIDFTAEAGKKRVLESIKLLIDLLFDKLEEEKRVKTMVGKMVADGIPLAKIADYLDVTERQAKNIVNNL